MPGQYFKVFSQRPVNLPSPQEMETRFTEAENRRLEIFNESMLKQQQQHTDAEKHQQEGEKLRSEQFANTMVSFNETFVTNEAHRDKTFRDTQVEHEEISRNSEISREKRFEEREASREECFQQDQDMRQKRSEVYAHGRHLHVQQGRQIREDSCRKLEKEVSDQIDLLMRFQESSFATAECQRDGIVKEILASAVHSKMDDDMVGNHAQPSPPVLRDVGPHVQPSSPELRDLGAHAQPSSPELPALVPHGNPTVIPVLDYPLVSSTTVTELGSPHFIRRLSRSRSRSPSGSRFLENPVYIPTVCNGRGETAESDHERKSEAKSLLTTPHHDFYEDLFNECQEHRRKEFLKEEDNRNLRFTQAETKRDGAEGLRTELFRRHEKHQELLFQLATSMRDKRFLRNQIVRDLGEQWRKQQFDEAEECRSQLCDQCRVWEREQYLAMTALETNSAKLTWMRRQVDKLIDIQRVSFAQAKKRRSATFSRSQARREHQLGVAGQVEMLTSRSRPPSPTLEHPAMSPLVIRDRRSRSRSRWRRHDFGSQRPQSRWSTNSLSASCLSSSYRSCYGEDLSAPPGQMHYVPSAGFDPRTIFMQTNLTDPLPVPVREERRRPFGEQQFYMAKRRQHLFEKSQAERVAAFEGGARKRQQVFSLGETKRQQEFEGNQRTRIEVSVDKERERDLKFGNDQIEREERFQGWEMNRERSFGDAERLRESVFRTGQARRNELFYSRQEELQRQCFEDENQRQSEFEGWEQHVLEILREQRDSFADEEKEREERFIAATRLRSSST